LPLERGEGHFLILYPVRYLWWLVTSLRRSLGRPPQFVMFVLEDDLPALPDPPRRWWQRFTSRPRLSVKELGDRFDEIARDSRVQGVVLHLRTPPMSMATLQDLRELVSRLRAAHKRVVAWAPFYTTGTYYLACACDEILLMPTGAVQAMGFATTGTFLADGLARVGLKADFIQVSPFKSAADPLTRNSMSPEFREQVTWLLQSQHAELVNGIAEGRLLNEEGARALIDGSPYGDDVAVERHVVDAIVPEEQLPARLTRSSGPAPAIGTWERARSRMRTDPPRLRRGRYVAVVRIEGTIVDGRSGRLPARPPIEVPLLGDDRAGDLTVVQAVRQVAADRRAAAAVLYVNSRGGSSTASEAMRQALLTVAARKPLVVVMGPIAGSGGYWVATPASWIVARPSTLTGSIGVLTGKIVSGEMWPKLDINRETIAFGRHATMNLDEGPFTPDERRILEDEVERIYGAFVELVGKARKMPVEKVHAIAQGKVWTGRQALERGLVDEMGGLEEGASKARALAGLGDDARTHEVWPPKRPLMPVAEAASPVSWFAYMLESLSLVRRAHALAVMEYQPGELT